MWRDGERGQSIQIGAVLLFGALIVALAGYQAFVVPQQNERVEFSHSQTVQNQLSDLRNAVVSVPGDSDPRSVSVQLGTRYPARVVAVNPGSPTGNIRTTGTDDPSLTFTIENARVDSDDETADFWDGSSRSYRTGTLVYRPNYNGYSQAPTTVYENSVLYNEFPSGTVTLADQTLVNGNRITLIALNGSYDATRSGTVSPDLEPVSTSTRTVSVTNGGDPVTIEVPTRLSEETWRDLLAEEVDDGHVVDGSVSVTDTGSEFETLSFELDTGEKYTLQMAKVGIGSDVTGTGEAYMTDVSGDGSTVVEGRSRVVSIEVRDKYNNPKSGVSVEADADGGTLLDPEDGDNIVTTGTDGRAAFEYSGDADAGGSDYELRFSTDDTSSNDATPSEFTESDATDVGMTVTVESTTSTVTGSGGDGAYRTTWQDPSGESGVTCDAEGDDCTLDYSIATSVTLTARTDPEAEDAVVRFARNRTDRGSLSTTKTTTDSDGQTTTTFTPTANGETKLYAVSGGSGDVINLTVTKYASTTTTAPDAYHDKTSSGSSQEDSIPPDTPLGSLSSFSGFTTDDGTVGTIDEASQTGSGNDNKQRARVGLRFPSVSSGSHIIEIEYELVDAGSETFELQVVDGNGDEIDDSTDYTLSNTGGLTTESFSLSTDESNWIDSNGIAYAVFEDSETGTGGNSDSTQTSVNVDYIEVRTDTSAALAPVGIGGGGSGPGSNSPAGRSRPAQTAETIALVVPVVLFLYAVLRRVRTRGQSRDRFAPIPT